MKNLLSFWIALMLITALSSCHKQLAIAQEFSCQNQQISDPKEIVSDFKKTFSLELPKHWNTKLYYDNKQSELFSADTLKSIDNTIIINASMVEESLTLDDNFKDRLEQAIKSGGLTTLKTGSTGFKSYEGYYHLGEGIDKNMPIRVFQWYIDCKDNRYFRLKIDIYGDENTDIKLCQALSLIRTLNINKQ